MDSEKVKPKKRDFTIERIGGYLHKVVPIKDSADKVIQYAITPLMVELRMRDIMQIIVGSSILAVPLAFTEETWNLGEQLPFLNVAFLSLLSLLFISMFVYFNFYRGTLKNHVLEYIKRIFAIYGFSLLVVGLLLTIIQKCPWGTDNILAIKRIIIVGFPASMSAAVSDVLK